MKAVVAGLAVILLSACEVVERAAPDGRKPATAPAAQAAPSVGVELLAYLGELRSLKEPALASEAARQKQRAAGSADDIARVKAALALTLAAPADEGDILALVDPVIRRQGGELRAMASFLQAIAHDRRRLRESAATARTGMNNERRALETQKQRADALEEKANELQQKLDALTELEKSLTDRTPPSR